MAKRTIASIWGRALQRNAAALGREAVRAGQRALGQAVKQAVKQTVKQVVKQTVKPATRQATQRSAPALRLAAGPGSWLPGLALGPAGPRRY